MQEFRKSVELAYDEILKKQNVVSAELLKNTLAKRAVIPTKLLQMGEREREHLLARSKEINSTSTYRHSGYYQKYLKDYLASLGKEDIEFSDITEDFGSSYKAFMKRNKNFSAQQINKCLCWLSKLVYLAVDYEILRANPLEDMEYEKKPAPKHRHISRAELKAILETPMLDPLQELGRRAFLFSTFTGLAYVDMQKGFSFIPGGHFLDNLKSVANDGSFPMFRGIVNSLIISGSCAVLCTYFSSLTAYGLYAYDFKLKKAAFTFIMAILVMPTQVTAMGFLRLITNMGMYDSWTPLIIPSIASPAVFYFMYSYLQSSLPLSLVEAARIDGSNEFRTFNHIVLPIMKPAIAVQAIFTFVGSWNNYFTPALIIQSKNKMTVPILIATLRGADYMNFDMGKIYMMITVAIVPIIVVYLLLSKYIIAGVTLGGVKE